MAAMFWPGLAWPGLAWLGLAWLGEDRCRREIACGDNLACPQMMTTRKAAIGEPDETVDRIIERVAADALNYERAIDIDPNRDRRPVDSRPVGDRVTRDEGSVDAVVGDG